MKLSATILSCVLVLMLSSTASAITWNVPADAPTIQAGIDSAGAGDTVVVACGTYYEYDIMMSSDVILRSETGLPDCVTIDAEEQGLVFYCASLGATSVVEGFTITGGLSLEGAGMYCTECGLLVSRCVFVGNEAQYGAGMHIHGSAVPVVRNCSFAGNVSPGSGGCVALSGLGVEFENTIIAFNQCAEPFYCETGGTPTLSCCDVYGNTGGDWVGCIQFQQGISGNFSTDPEFCNWRAGDVHLWSCSPCLNAPGCGLVGALGAGDCGKTWYVPADAPTIQAGIDTACAGDTVVVASGTYHEHDIVMKSGVTLRSETGLPDCVTIDADSLGRVFYCDKVDGAATIEGLTITGGHASGTLWETFGGGMFICDSHLTIAHCTICGNSSENEGGGIFLISNEAGYWSNATITHCTIYGNWAPPNAGGGMFIGELGGTPNTSTVNNTIIAFNLQGGAVSCLFQNGICTFGCCDLYGNVGGDYICCYSGGNFS